MIELKETITVRRPMDDVFRYMSNFANIAQWDPGVISSVKVTEGAVGTGSVFALELRYGLFPVRMRYTILEYEEPSRVILKGTGDSFAVTDTIELSECDGVTTVNYAAAFDFPHLPTWLERLARPVLTRIGKASMNGLRKTLASHARPPQSVALFAGRTNPLDMISDRLVVPGALGFSKWGYRVGKAFWKANAEPLHRKSVVLTGATSGLGRAAALGLAEGGAKITFIARNREKALATQQALTLKTGNDQIDFYIADLSLMADVKRVAHDILRDKAGLDVLINNAGALFPERSETGEGLEQTFATNLLGVFALTRLLLEGLSRTKRPRIINVSSGGMYTQKIHVNDLEMEHSPYDGATAYARAKRGLVILTEIWADQLNHKGFSVHAMHPGWVDTPGLAASLQAFHKRMRPLLRTPAQGADTIVWLASAMEPGECTGLFWLDRRPHTTHVLPGTRETEDERRQLWKALETYEKRLR